MRRSVPDARNRTPSDPESPECTGPRRPTAAPANVVLTREGRSRLEARLRALQEKMSGPRDEGSEDLVRVAEEASYLASVLRASTALEDLWDDPETVELGDEVTVRFEDGSVETYLIVHPIEAALDDFRVSAESPLSRALIGRGPGERVEVHAPGGAYTCTLVSRRRTGGTDGAIRAIRRMRR